MSLRNRVAIVLYIISFTVSLFIFSYIASKSSIDIECTSYSQYAVDGSDIYYAQNLRNKGVIFKLNAKGRVTDMFQSTALGDPRVIGLSTKEDNVYAVISGFLEEKDENGEGIISTPVYRVVCFDKSLRIQTQSPKFALDEKERLTGFSAEPTGLFLTTVYNDGSLVKVYALDENVMKDPDDVQDDQVKLEGVRSKTNADLRFYSDAVYKEGELYVRTDEDMPTQALAIDPQVKSVVADMKLSVGQLFGLYTNYVIWYVAILIVWFIILYLLIKMFTNRNRSFYYIVIAEVLIAVVVGACVYAVDSSYRDARETEHSRFAAISLTGLADTISLNDSTDFVGDDFYDSERYDFIRSELIKFINLDGNSDIIYDVFVYRVRDNIICASASGRNLQATSELYGEKILDLSDDIEKGNRYAAVDLVIEGQDYRAVAVTYGVGTPDHAYVAIINDTTNHASVYVDNRGIFILFALAFAIASALIVLVWYLHMRDFTVLETALSNTALGGDMPEKPVMLGHDVKDMWDSVSEIHKRVDEIEYSKVRILEAYYRFAPKNVEKVLGKNSIIEVRNGDNARGAGTMVMMEMDLWSKLGVKKLNSVITTLGTYQREHDCIIIGKHPDMSFMQVLFMQNEKNIVSVLINIFNDNVKEGHEGDLSTVLYFDQYRFGVLGSDEEATTYFEADNNALASRISNFVKKRGLGLIITDTVMDRENIKTPLRFVGYAGTDKAGNMVRLYEVLDAYPARVRAQRIATMDRYNEALKSYYEKDFYIARTKFSDILKDSPDDALIKWYVFESDKYLNETIENDDYKLLWD